MAPQVANKSNTVIKMYEKGEWVSVETAVNESLGTLSVDMGHLDDFAIFEGLVRYLRQSLCQGLW